MKTTTLAAALLCSASFAHAQVPGLPGFPAFQVFDSRGAVVGQAIDDKNFWTKINGQTYDIEVFGGPMPANRLTSPLIKLQPSADFEFASTDCSGKPLLPAWRTGLVNQQGLVRTAWYQAVAGRFGAGNVFWDVDMSQPQKLTPIGSAWIQELNDVDPDNPYVEAFCYSAGIPPSDVVQPATPLNAAFAPPFCIGGRAGLAPCRVDR